MGHIFENALLSHHELSLRAGAAALYLNYRSDRETKRYTGFEATKVPFHLLWDLQLFENLAVLREVPNEDFLILSIRILSGMFLEDSTADFGLVFFLTKVSGIYGSVDLVVALVSFEGRYMLLWNHWSHNTPGLGSPLYVEISTEVWII